MTNTDDPFGPILGQGFYLLTADKVPYRVSIAKWSDGWHKQRRVAMTVKDKSTGRPYASTIFLGIDTGSGKLLDPDGDHKPLVFETMIIGGPHNGHQVRTATWDEALEAHAEAVNLMESADD